MSTKTLMSVEEYSRTSFEDGDRDFVDGEIEERYVGERFHSLIQALLIQRFLGLQGSLEIQILPEIRIQIDDHRFRVADVAVWSKKLRGPGVPNRPPFLAIEILSPEDRMIRVLPRIADYLRAGVSATWVIDPQERKAMIFAPEQPTGVVTDMLRASDPAIEIPLADVLPSDEDYAGND